MLTMLLVGAVVVGIGEYRQQSVTGSTSRQEASTPQVGEMPENMRRPSPSARPAETEPAARPPVDGTQMIDIAEAGPGDFIVSAPSAPPEHDPGIGELTYTVEIEVGLPFDPAATADAVDGILDDVRGWPGAAEREFHPVADAGELRILVATPGTTDQLCSPLETNGEVSCRNGELVVLNARRWAFGTEDYQDTVPEYRTYLVNHEVGHAIGYAHVQCSGPGEPAPVMQQQTYGLDGCRRNAWPTVA
ncbi:DUF3152 domain-containing protein [Aeromicrobium piscarium]|uniref:DUF3152 domain-containing protein n=2 Tax=Aeromicrobium piscarium TaxID=2590901 RepID=A0A554RG90_9ACTN|nr:DUF3152 domain-containing protein [Aeromicrobium piscarium]